MAKKLCKCGDYVEQLHAYFDKRTGYRITCCEKCAEQHNLTDSGKYERRDYTELSAEQNITPEPDAN